YISTLSLHDALPICVLRQLDQGIFLGGDEARRQAASQPGDRIGTYRRAAGGGRGSRDRLPRRAGGAGVLRVSRELRPFQELGVLDRKSTRLNSSHDQ